MNNFINLCKKNDLEAVKQVYFSAIEKVFVFDEKGNTPAHIAILEGNYNILNFLIKNDIFLNIENYDKKTVFQIAIENEDKNCIKLLLENFGIDVFLFSLPNKFLGNYMLKSNDDFIDFINKVLKEEEIEIKDLFMEYEDIKSISLLKNDEDFALEISLHSIEDMEELLSLLEYTISNNKIELSKKVFIEMYKKNKSFVIENIISPLEIAISFENYTLVNLIIESIEEKNINFKEVLKCACLFSSLNFISSIIKKYNINIKNIEKTELLKISSLRNSVNIFSLFSQEFELKPSDLMLKEKIHEGKSAEFVSHLKDLLPFSSKVIYKTIVELIYENEKNDFIKELLIRNKELLEIRIDNTTLLHHAIDAENYFISKFLLDNNLIDPNIINIEGQSALSIAINKNLYIFELLFNYNNVDFDTFDNDCNSIFNLLQKRKIDFKAEKILMLLNKSEFSYNIVNTEGKNIVHYLIEEDNDFLLAKFINKGLKKDIVYAFEESYLDYALKNKSLKCIQILKENNFLFFKELPVKIFTEGILEEYVLGLDYINTSNTLSNYTKDSVFYNNLALINKVKDIKMLRMLFSYGFNIDGVSQDIFSPLMSSIERKDTEFSLFLISRGCILNTIVNTETTLSLAVKNKDIMVIKALCNKRIDIPFKNLNITDPSIANIIKESLPLRKLKKHGLVKESILDKKPLFGKKTYKQKYIINKEDSSYIVDIKNILNIYEVSETIQDFFKNLMNTGYEPKGILDNQAFDDIKIYCEKNVLKLEDLNLKVTDLKERLKYSFENDYLFLVKNLSVEDSKNLNLILLNKIYNGLIELKNKYAINGKQIGYIINNQNYNSSTTFIKKIIMENDNG